MKWITHQAVAVGVGGCLGMPYAGVGAAFAGAVLPDVLDQRLAGLFWDRQKAFSRIHRGSTHWFGWWLVLWVGALWIPLPEFAEAERARAALSGLGFGALMHVVLDMCTPSGVPLLPWNRQSNVSLKLCKTGSVGEYLFLLAALVLFVLLNKEETLSMWEQARRLLRGL